MNQKGTPVTAAVAAQRLTKDLRDIWKGLYMVLFNPTVSTNQAQSWECCALRNLIDGYAVYISPLGPTCWGLARRAPPADEVGGVT